MLGGAARHEVRRKSQASRFGLLGDKPKKLTHTQLASPNWRA
jgi:hypothetical protein